MILKTIQCCGRLETFLLLDGALLRLSELPSLPRHLRLRISAAGMDSLTAPYAIDNAKHSPLNG